VKNLKMKFFCRVNDHKDYPFNIEF